MWQASKHWCQASEAHPQLAIGGRGEGGSSLHEHACVEFILGRSTVMPPSNTMKSSLLIPLTRPFVGIHAFAGYVNQP